MRAKLRRRRTYAVHKQMRETSEKAIKKMPGKLSALQRLILRLAAQNEPKATVLEDPKLKHEAEALIAARVLGRVEVRGEEAYRLTDFGRLAVAELGFA